MPNDDTSAAAGLAATLAEFDTPPASPGEVQQPPMDDFLASFDLPGNPAETPAGPAAPDPKPEDAPPAPAEPAKTDDTDDPYPEEPPAKGTDAAKTHGWGNLKSDLKKTRAELRAERDATAKAIQEKDAKLAEYEKQIAQLPELSEKAKFVEDAERELAIARVEGTRDFKETIVRPLEAIDKAAKAIAESSGIKLDDILDVLTEPDIAKQEERLEELSSGLSAVAQLKLFRMAEDSRMLLAKRDDILGNAVAARKELETINQQRETAAQKAARETFEKAVDHTVGELKARIPFVPLADGETADAMFAAMAEKARASDFDAASPSVKAFAAAAGVLLPRVTKQLVNAQAEIKKLQARIAEGNATKPSIGNAPAPTPASDDNEDFMDRMNGFLGLQKSQPITSLVEA